MRQIQGQPLCFSLNRGLSLWSWLRGRDPGAGGGGGGGGGGQRAPLPQYCAKGTLISHYWPGVL